MTAPDRIYTHCKELVTLQAGPPTGARRGSELRDVGVIEDGAVAVADGRILATGTTAESVRLSEEHDGARVVAFEEARDLVTFDVNRDELDALQQVLA